MLRFGLLPLPPRHRKILELVDNLEQQENKLQATDDILTHCAAIETPLKDKLLALPSNIADDIKGDIHADYKELEKCFAAGCYRSTVILCGRLLETALHRVYFETTGLDILEKNPGIGLGNLIGKLSEKNVTFDPGLTQQIHLINQVRVFSVHKKKEPFYPSKAQAQAMILYTTDILSKIFKK